MSRETEKTLASSLRPWIDNGQLRYIQEYQEVPFTLHTPFKTSDRTRQNLIGVHPELVDFVNHLFACSFADFSVISGVRTKQEQQQLVFRGRSKTMKSAHRLHKCENPTGYYGLAVDLWPILGRMATENDGGLPAKLPFRLILLATYAQKLARHLDLPIVWGGTFKDLRHHEILETLAERTVAGAFVDMPHYQITIPDAYIAEHAIISPVLGEQS